MIFTLCVWKIYVETYFQNEGGIILLLGAPVKSKFDGLKFRKRGCYDFWIWGDPLEPLFVDLYIPNHFEKSKKIQNMFGEYDFWQKTDVRSVKLSKFGILEIWNFEIVELWKIAFGKRNFGIVQLWKFELCNFETIYIYIYIYI